MHHWTDKRLYDQITKFYNYLNLLNFQPTEKDIWAMAVMIYPAKGIKKIDKKGNVTQIKCLPAHQVLGDFGF